MKFAVLIIASLVLRISLAQKTSCGATEMLKKSIQENPMLEKAMEKGNQFTAIYSKNPNKDKANGNYVIPIVFHIIHENGPENVSKEQIKKALQELNDNFQKKHVDVDQISTEFASIAANTQIEFRLAQIDPEGKCTDGITRTVSEHTFFNTFKIHDIVDWGSEKYLNIWVVRDISHDPSTVGYATFPPGVVKGDGIVLEYYTLESSRSTLTHEVGHYLGLNHTWGPGNNPGLPNNCNADDGVDDTPNTIGGVASCNSPNETCGSLDNIENYMDYTPCGRMFTEGQKIKMHATLNNPQTPLRNNLWIESNIMATGTNDGFTHNCAPLPEFISSQKTICQNNSIEFVGLSYNTDTTANWNWSFPGGNPSTSSVQNPTVAYKEGGEYDVSLMVSNNYGTNSITKEGYITVFGPSNTEEFPFLEGLENDLFPYLHKDSMNKWEITQSGGWWTRDTVGATGTRSFRILHRREIEDFTIITSPPINLLKAKETNLHFKIAFAQVQDNPSLTMNMKVYVSKNCGKNWSLTYLKSKPQLITNGGKVSDNNFVPLNSEWRQEVVPLNNFDGEPSILIRFELAGNAGGFFYIDDINITNDSITPVKDVYHQKISLTVFPNPVTENSIVEMMLYRPTNITLELTDILGNSIKKTHLGKIEGLHQSQFLKDLSGVSSGVYLLSIIAGDKKVVRKIMV